MYFEIKTFSRTLIFKDVIGLLQANSCVSQNWILYRKVSGISYWYLIRHVCGFQVVIAKGM